jgi:hypothetical protein
MTSNNPPRYKPHYFYMNHLLSIVLSPNCLIIKRGRLSSTYLRQSSHPASHMVNLSLPQTVIMGTQVSQRAYSRVLLPPQGFVIDSEINYLRYRFLPEKLGRHPVGFRGSVPHQRGEQMVTDHINRIIGTFRRQEIQLIEEWLMS